LDKLDGITVICKSAALKRDYSINETLIKAVAHQVRGQLGLPRHELSITLTNSAGIRILNKDFRGIDQSTDVLAFPQMQWEAPQLTVTPEKGNTGAKILKKSATPPGPPEALGDIVISLTDAEKNAAFIGQSLDREIAFLIVHGILHLCGHDHLEPNDEEIMTHQQQKLMTLLNEADGNITKPLWLAIASSRLPASMKNRG
jgi:probable rRNA maturation factor